MPADPIELQIVEEFRTRLETILTADGFHTDAGQNVHLGRVIDEELDTLPALVVWISKAAPVTDGSVVRKLRWELPIIVEGVVRVTEADPLEETLKLAQDIKKAVFRPTSLVLVDGTQPLKLVDVEHFPAEPGSNVATAQVSFSVPFVESMG